MKIQNLIKTSLVATGLFCTIFSTETMAQKISTESIKGISKTDNTKAKTVIVTNVQQFLDAIGSNTIIQLKGHSFHISDLANSGKSSANYDFREVYDGFELLIHDVKNLTIIGLGNTPVRMYAKPEYGNVIAFDKCENITIENVDAGHGASKGSCVGGVFKIENTTNFFIKNTVMYGSGIEGITTNNVTNLVCSNSFIRSCTYSIMTLTSSKDILFESCVFEDNGVYDLVNITSSSNVSFKNCSFEKNRTESSTYALFKISSSTNIKLENCFVESNAADYFCNDSKALTLQNVQINHNDFTKGQYQN